MPSQNPELINWSDSFDDLEPGDFEFSGGPDDDSIEASYEMDKEDYEKMIEEDYEMEEHYHEALPPDEATDPEPAQLTGDNMNPTILNVPQDIINYALQRFNVLHNLSLHHLNHHGEYTLQGLIQDTIDRLEVGRNYLLMKDEDDPDVVNMMVLAIPQEVIDDYALGTLDVLRNLRIQGLDQTGETAIHALIYETIVRLKIAQEQLDYPAGQSLNHRYNLRGNPLSSI